MKTILSVCSARPNFVKLAAVHHALSKHTDQCRHVIVHTGQHYDPLLSDVFFEQLDIPQPSFNLGIAGGEREEVIQQTEDAIRPVLEEVQPDIVLVYGDVNGAVGAARAASTLKLTIGHVEAGLRSFDDAMPEEHNRIEIDQLADLLFCTEQSGLDHLEEEEVRGVPHLVGNTMIDTLIRMQDAIEMQNIDIDLPKRYAVITMHRPSNVDDLLMLRHNVDVLCQLGGKISLILPIHHRFKAALEKEGLLQKLSDVLTIIPAMGYMPFLKLISHAAFIVTDSGGIQEEATFLKKRCYTLRKNTERPSTVQSGSNRLLDLTKPADLQTLLNAPDAEDVQSIAVPPLWDGKAGERICEVLCNL